MLSNQVYRAHHLCLWNARLSKDNLEPLVDKVVEAVMYQQGIPVDHSNEYRNIYSYDKLWDSLAQYGSESGVSVPSEHYLAGANQAFRIFARPKGVGKLRPVSLSGSSAQLFRELAIKPDTSAGLTAYGMSKWEAFTVGLDKAVDILTSNKAPTPCLAGVRTQRKGKTRLVWGYPLEMTILEAIIARPLIDMFKGADHVMTFGDFSLEIGQRMRCSSSTTKYHYSLDYSQFDASINAPLIRHAFNALKTWYDMDEVVYEGVTVRQLFQLVESYFIKTPIIMPNRNGQYPLLVKGKKQGVPSGSYFTQLVDSFANVSLIMSANSRFRLGIKDKDLFVLGDDCLFFCNVDVSITLLSNYLSNFGFKVNSAKGSRGLATDPIQYLGRTWKNGFPIRTLGDIQRGGLYPEKYRRYDSNRGVRQEQALAVISSYLLTSFIEDSPIGTSVFNHCYMVSPWMASGITKYLMAEGLMPGKVLKRALY